MSRWSSTTVAWVDPETEQKVQQIRDRLCRERHHLDNRLLPVGTKVFVQGHGFGLVHNDQWTMAPPGDGDGAVGGAVQPVYLHAYQQVVPVLVTAMMPIDVLDGRPLASVSPFAGSA